MRTLLLMTCLLAVLLPAAADDYAMAADPFQALPGRVLTTAEMETISGSLRIFGVQILPKLQRVNRKQKTSAPSKVHCDIIAQNRAESLGLNTQNQDGSFTDYNYHKVESIYEGYPSNRSSTPSTNTSGYVFTAYGGNMQHMETYSRGTSSSYTRYWNDSYDEFISSRDVGYVPPGVTDQMFVPLPEYGYYDLYYR